MSYSKVAIVILNWNGRKHLEQFLPSVLLTDYPNFDVVVADNGSSDDSISYLQSNHPSVRIIELGKNFGFAKGYNLALKNVECDYYVILNSDVEVTPDWLKPMVKLLDNDIQIAACQPKILSYKNRTFFEYAGGSGGWLDKFGYPFARGRIFDVYEEDLGQYDDTSPIFWASGASLFIRARVFHEMNGFDEYFFAHQEEIDLCWRIQLAGHKIFACPAAVVYHLGGGTLATGNAYKTFLNFRNNRIMLSKHLPFSRKLLVIPVRFFLDSLSAFKGLFTGNPGYFLAIFKSRAAFLKWKIIARKAPSGAVNKRMNLSGYLQKNVVWQHFFNKKNYFSEIVEKSK